MNEYLIVNESDERKREIRKIIGLDLKTFQCPLCKQISNSLLPTETLSDMSQQVKNAKDLDINNVLDFFATFYSKILYC